MFLTERQIVRRVMDGKIYVKEHQEKKQKMEQPESIYSIYEYQKKKINADNKK
jgi:hypothetical protein